MAKTFRQEVEEATTKLARREITATEADRLICEAAKRMGERMPETEWSKEPPKTQQALIRHIAQEDYKMECQAHIAKETEG